MNRHPAGKRRALSEEPFLLWDRVHNRPADIYTPPEDTLKRALAQRYRITTTVGSVTEQTLEEIEAEGGFAYLFTVARNLGLGAITVEALE
jgi:hypothetical protein